MTANKDFHPIDKPHYYNVGGIETWDFIVSRELDYLTGNAVKYASRYPFKENPAQDLKKCIAYIKRRIEEIGEGIVDMASVGPIDTMEYGRSWNMPIKQIDLITALVGVQDKKSLARAVELADELLAVEEAKVQKEEARRREGLDWLESLRHKPWQSPPEPREQPWITYIGDGSSRREYPFHIGSSCSGDRK